MSSQSNSTNPIISLPQGGGALSGIGEKFSPDLHTGTGNYTVPIALPPGRNGFQPDLKLVYSTGNGNGPFGLGWSLSIPGVSRKTSDGVPRYNETKKKLDAGERRDVFILSGAEDLVPVSGSYPGEAVYRPRTEGLFARITHHQDAQDPPGPGGNYWKVESKDGLISLYGTPDQTGMDPAVLTKPDDTKRIFAWKLTQTRDPFGNRIRYDYLPASGDKDGHRWRQPLLKRIRYADYGDPAGDRFLVDVEFEYEDERPDPFSDYRAGFEIRTTKRCRTIKVITHMADGKTHAVREYVFTYTADAYNGISLLQQIDIIGFDDEGNAYRDPQGEYKKQLPPLTFGYTGFEPERRRFETVEGDDLPAHALGSPDMELVDLHGSGLPDILEMNEIVRYWRNLGNGRFDMPRPMQEAPPHFLSDPGVQLIDADGDGRMDLLVTSGSLAGYYPLTHGAIWNRNSFRAYRQSPSFSLEDPEVRLIDLDGDGITDAIRSGTRLECFFNDPEEGWTDTRFVERRSAEYFPDVSFSDPRVKWADMTGDGMQDIVLVYDGNIEFWPSLGRGNWGSRIHMRSSPRFKDSGHTFGYDPRRVLIGDVDGDGLADVVYAGDREVTLWINRSGNAFSDPITIPGTPPVAGMDDVRLVDLYGTGVSGLLWSSEATALSGHCLMFLDFTGRVKPYVLDEMDNHMGAVTRVEYRPSTHFYLEDQERPGTRWRTPLPFPVQVVSKVETIDEVSKGKLTTEYRYHHGYWDGAEREFRGFGLVEQFDTESFDDYHSAGLNGDSDRFTPVSEKHFSPPTLTKTWFHQGPVGEEFGDWAETDYTGEYWQGDPQLLEHTEEVNEFLRGYNDRPGQTPSPRNRRIKRDALRTLRGSILRTELYALDGSERSGCPYTVTEHAYSLQETAAPPDPDRTDRRRIFFPHLLAQRTTQWERGDDPMTQFSLTDYRDEKGDFDPLGRPHRQTTIAMPRLAGKRRLITGAVVGDIRPDETRILATNTLTSYAAPDTDKYIHDRAAQTKSFEFLNPPGPPDAPGDDAQAALRKQWAAAKQIADAFAVAPAGEVRVFSHTVNHYDGQPFEGLRVGLLGEFGALVRTETLILTEEILIGACGPDRRPFYLDGVDAIPDLPAGFGSGTGYRRVNAGSDAYLDGWYADTQRRRYDFHGDWTHPRGLVEGMLDPLGNETRIGYDVHNLLPQKVTNARRLETRAAYNYRVLQPLRMTDPNGTSTNILYSPIGLPERQFVRGTDAQGNETLGGTKEKPEILFKYDFLNFAREGKPVFVHTMRRIHHASDNISDDTIETREYSDGFGRLLQTRSQAEEFIFGDTLDDVGLPPQPYANPPAFARRTPDSVVVSGWQIYDNKGRVTEKYEPFFSHLMEFELETDAKRGSHATMFYDARGNLIRTRNHDGSQQRVILGRPEDPSDLKLDADGLASSDVPDNFEPTPWETYAYDSNDLADLTHRGADRSDAGHHFTPTSSINDSLGHVLCQVQRNGSDPEQDWFITRTDYDLRGNALKITDALGRDTFQHSYDLLNKPLRMESIDAGLRTSLLDAMGNLIEYRDSKGSLVRRTYDELNRLTELWARNESDSRVTLRERILYGDESDHALSRTHNTLGRPVRHYDEAGLLEMPEYDFKGNLLEKSRRTIRDEMLAIGWVADWSAADAEDALEDSAYQTGSGYDALNRLIELTYPEDVDGERKKLRPHYNRAGALEAVSLDGQEYVRQIAYNARGQRVLIAYGNGVMTRHAYDHQTFRLARLRTDRVRRPGFSSPLTDLFAVGDTDTLTFETTGPAIQDFTCAYDLAGNITRIDELTPNCGIASGTGSQGRDRLTRKFTYDPIYRLLSATGRACKNIGVPLGLRDDPRCGFYTGGSPAPTQDNAPDLTEHYTERYSYDPAGNMLELGYRAASGNWKRLFGMAGLPNDRWKEAWNNRLTTLVNGSVNHAYLFDDNGNLIRQNSEKHHTWDHADRMTGFSVHPAAGPASIEACYLYGADGMRVKKWVRTQDGKVITSSYIDGFFEQHRLKNRTEDKINNTLHVMDSQSHIAMVRIGSPLDAIEASPQAQYLLGDHLGSSHVVVGGGDAAAIGFINREEYFPFGETSFGSFGRKRYRYNGKERDEESGLYYYGVRYLAPWLARWTSSDPIGFAGGLNAYIYAANDPMRMTDQKGEQAEEAGNEIVFDEVSITGSKDPQEQISTASKAKREVLRNQDIEKLSRSERRALARQYTEEMHDLRREAMRQGAIEWAKFAAGTNFIAAVSALAALGGAALGIAAAEGAALTFTGEALVVGMFSGAGGAAGAEVAEVSLGKELDPKKAAENVAKGASFGTVLGFGTAAVGRIGTPILPRRSVDLPNIRVSEAPLPQGLSSNKELGDLVNWSHGSPLKYGFTQLELQQAKSAAMSHTNEVVRGLNEQQLIRFREAGLTREIAQTWSNAYYVESIRTPSNANARARAELMQAIADRL